MIKITRQSAMEALENAVAVRGEDFIYNLGGDYLSNCTYVQDGRNATGEVVDFCDMVDPRPSCLVGHALNSLGVSLEDLHALEHRPASDVLAELRYDKILTAEYGVEEIFDCVQSIQDTGGSWGSALVAAWRRNRSL